MRFFFISPRALCLPTFLICHFLCRRATVWALDNQTGLRPIQGIIPTEPLWLQYLLWAAALIITLLVGTGLLLRYRKRQTRKTVLRKQPDPIHDQIRKALAQLEKNGLFEQGQVKEFYFRLSEILRRYVGHLRGFPAAEFTTEEIAPYLSRVKDRKLLPLLRQADLIKFADTIPTPAKKDEHLTIAFLYVEANRPTPENGNMS